MEKLFRQLVEMRTTFSIKYDGENYVVYAWIKPTTDGECFVGTLSVYCDRLINARGQNSDLELALKMVINELLEKVEKS